MNNRLLIALYVLANLTFIIVIIIQWSELKEFPDIILKYSEYRKKEYLGINKYLVQCLFYLIGLGLSFFVLRDLLKRKIVRRKTLFLYGIYFLLLILFELPFYDKHIGWGNLHGHSYWKGFHFH